MKEYYLFVAGGAAFLLTAALGKVLIPFLHKLKYGQTILDIGPSWHKNKQGTPTMGGIMFIIGITAAVCAGYAVGQFANPAWTQPDAKAATMKMFLGLVMALLFGVVGFLDDYLKVVKKQNEGFTAKQKSLCQLLIAVVYLFGLYIMGEQSTVIVLPFIGQLDIGLLYYPFMVFIIVGVVNAVNLTDGIDGLASSVTLVAAVGFMAISVMFSSWQNNLLAVALAGGCAGFLVWNFYPAKVFMGDTGSLFLGGLVVALAFGLNIPVFLVFIGIVYMLETLSVIIQVTSFKLTGKRVFKMSPIHHHFEMSGYSEIKIVMLFSAVTAIGCAAAVGAAALI
ncbi:MAG: phospho-N-acetylmuramoyl-pentapeptide-transferase [Oscillospiraceae bacterium]|nr:phospho-N-acetylmuramoyl-pentapeptide-transferase [Oscillospiraceae bacterium]